VRAIHGRNALSSDMEEPFRLSSSFGRRIAQVRLDVAFPFQSIERGINGADGNLAARAYLDLLPYSDPIGTIRKTQKRQDDNVFKLAEKTAI
jgi:hypothetical protein